MARANHDRWEDGDGREPTATADAVESIEVYQADDGIVLYDARNPLAWVQSNRSVGLEESR